MAGSSQLLNHATKMLSLKEWTSINWSGQLTVAICSRSWTPELPKPPKQVLKMEVEFLVVKEIVEMLSNEFIKDLGDSCALLFVSRHTAEQGVKSN